MSIFRAVFDEAKLVLAGTPVLVETTYNTTTGLLQK